MRTARHPPSDHEPEVVGVAYVFAVQRAQDSRFGQDWWKIKLRATARADQKLTEVEKLLDNYRW